MHILHCWPYLFSNWFAYLFSFLSCIIQVFKLAPLGIFTFAYFREFLFSYSVASLFSGQIVHNFYITLFLPFLFTTMIKLFHFSFAFFTCISYHVALLHCEIVLCSYDFRVSSSRATFTNYFLVFSQSCYGFWFLLSYTCFRFYFRWNFIMIACFLCFSYDVCSLPLTSFRLYTFAFISLSIYGFSVVNYCFSDILLTYFSHVFLTMVRLLSP